MTQVVKQSDIQGTCVKSDDRYMVIDNTFLKNLTLSRTILQPGKSTSGHRHEGLEELYFFDSGEGVLQINEGEEERTFLVGPGSIALIADGDFHKVTNASNSTPLVFTCVFQKYER